MSDKEWSCQNCGTDFMVPVDMHNKCINSQKPMVMKCPLCGTADSFSVDVVLGREVAPSWLRIGGDIRDTKKELARQFKIRQRSLRDKSCREEELLSSINASNEGELKRIRKLKELKSNTPPTYSPKWWKFRRKPHNPLEENLFQAKRHLKDGNLEYALFFVNQGLQIDYSNKEFQELIKKIELMMRIKN